jgi:hypothetical protein
MPDLTVMTWNIQKFPIGSSPRYRRLSAVCLVSDGVLGSG